MSAITGGVTRTLRPLDFASGMVSVGDIDTIAAAPATVAVGAGAQALQFQGLAVGNLTVALSFQSIAIGPGAQSLEAISMAIGQGAIVEAGCFAAMAAGYNSHIFTGSSGSVAIGQGAAVRAGQSISILATISTNGTQQVVLGSSSDSAGIGQNVLVGPNCHIAGGGNNIVIGSSGSQTNSDNAVVIGAGSNVVSIRATAIGTSALVDANSDDTLVAGSSAHATINTSASIVIGNHALADGTEGAFSAAESIVIGRFAQSTSAQAISIGSGAHATSTQAVCLGVNASVDLNCVNSIAIGTSAALSATAQDSIAIGTNAFIDGTGGNEGNESICIGSRSQVKGLQTIRIGAGGAAGEDWSIWLGDGITAVNGAESVCIGHQSSVIDKGVTVGSLAQGSSDSVTIGLSSLTQAVRSVAVGSTSAVYVGTSAIESIAIGYLATINDSVNLTTSNRSIAIGVATTVIGSGAVALGHSAVVGAPTHESDDSIAIGHLALINGTVQAAIAIGHSAAVSTTAHRGIAIGENTLADLHYSIAIGAETITQNPNSLEIGNSFAVPTGGAIGDAAIHSIRVQGYNLAAGGAIDTLLALDAPVSAGEVGLRVVLNTTGIAWAQKTVFAAAVPPPGSLLLYFVP